MNIALIHYAAPPVVGGVETVLARQAQVLAKAGHQVQILAGRGQTWDERLPVHVFPLVDSRHPEVLQVKTALDSGSVPDAFSELVIKIKAELHPILARVDVLIAHNVGSLHKNLALTAALFEFSQAEGMPRLILWHHDLAWTTPRYLPEMCDGYPWDLLRSAWPGVRQVVVSDARRQELADLMGISPQEISVIPAGLDMPAFLALDPVAQALNDRLDLARSAPLLLAPVRLTPRKNIELALHILSELRKIMPAAALVVTGPPGAHNPANAAYLEKLRLLRRDLALEDSAHLLAEFHPEGLPEESVASLYRLADALLLPSREEGFGIPILEAGLARLPVFCTDLPPLRALAGSSAFYFSPDGSPKSIARAIARLLKADPHYELGVRVRTGYTWEAVYDHQIAPLLEIS